MKRIADYYEFTGDSKSPKLVSGLHSPMQNKETILCFLESGEETAAMAHSMRDFIDGSDFDASIIVFTNGEYVWTNEEIYHFEKYDIKLNDEFIQYVLNRPE